MPVYQVLIKSCRYRNLTIQRKLEGNDTTVLFEDYKIVYPYPFKYQPQKMVKHSETIRRQMRTNSWSVFDHFVGLTLKGLSFCILF